MKAAGAKIPRSSAILAGSLIIIFVIALLIRLSPVFLYEPLLKEFDPFYFMRNVDYIVNNGFPAWFSWRDYSAWYPFGRDVPGTTYPGMVFTAVILHYFVNAIGIHVSTFAVCYYMPVVFGALTPIVVYFLAKELFDSRAGVLAAFFIAVSPAIIQRQVAGFFDNEPFGIFVMLVTFYFFVRSLKRGSVPSAIAAGLSLGFICISWGTYVYVIDIFTLFAFLMLIMRRYSVKLFNTYSITMLIGLFIAVLAPRNTPSILKQAEILPAIFLLGVLIVYESVKYLTKVPLFSRLGMKIKTFNPFILFTLVAAGFIVIFALSPIGPKFLTVIIPIFRDQQARILASVGEQQPTEWGTFFWYVSVVLVLAVVGLWFAFKRLQDADIFIIISAITLIYFAGSMVRIVITLSPILAVLAGYGLSSTLKPFARIMSTPKEEIVHRKRVRITPSVGRDYSAVAFFLIGIIVFAYGGTIISNSPGQSYPLIQLLSPPDILPGGAYRDWLQAMAWLNNEAPPGAVVASWWDYGYYITCVGNRTSVDDNGTINSTQIALVGLAFMQTNETATLQILQRWNASYVLVYFGHMQSSIGGDEGKWLWMLRIAADNFASKGLIDETQYFDESSGLIQPKFFDTTLYRLMYNLEPLGQTTLDAYLIAAMGTSSSQYHNKIATESFPAVGVSNTDTTLLALNDYWQTTQQLYDFTPVTSIDAYGPQFFKVAFASNNHLVKIYKVDYTPLQMMGNLQILPANTTFYKNNGTVTLNVKNIGGNSTPAIPLNRFTDWTGRVHTGALWLNNTYQWSIDTPIKVWNGTAYVSHSETYYLNPGQSAIIQIQASPFVNGTLANLRLVSSYYGSIYATAQVSFT
ncbi:MAG: STT3 domain-containing protein [Candidatus Atabeyarchaeum deiterrae]